MLTRISRFNVIKRYQSSFVKALKGLDSVFPSIGLSEDQVEYYSLARGFAEKEMKPYAGNITYKYSTIVYKLIYRV
jgi:hypothetical protein